MTYNLLIGGYRKTIANLQFDPSTAKLKKVSESPAPKAASWLEPSTVLKNVVYSLNEDDSKPKVISLTIDGDDVKIVSERGTNIGPAHVHCMKDGSGVVVSHYLGGTVAFYPTDSDGKLSQTSKSPNLSFPFAYEKEKAPNPERQEQCHLHQVIEGDNGVLYCMDLGGDRIWVVERQGESELEIKGYLQCPGGSGPRHAVISPDGKHLYVLTEMGHSLFIFSLDNPSYPAHPLPDVEVSIIPPSVPKEYQTYMDSSELCFNPAIPGVLYASNRWELHINEKNKDSSLPPFKPESPASGDAIAIVLLSGDGSKIESVTHVRTACDAVRGMQVSRDGKFVAVAGQEGGGVEIWKIEGERGDDWKLAAKEHTLEQVTDIVWL